MGKKRKKQVSSPSAGTGGQWEQRGGETPGETRQAGPSERAGLASLSGGGGACTTYTLHRIYVLLGRKTTEVKCHSHDVISR